MRHLSLGAAFITFGLPLPTFAAVHILVATNSSFVLVIQLDEGSRPRGPPARADLWPDLENDEYDSPLVYVHLLGPGLSDSYLTIYTLRNLLDLAPAPARDPSSAAGPRHVDAHARTSSQHYSGHNPTRGGTAPRSWLAPPPPRPRRTGEKGSGGWVRCRKRSGCHQRLPLQTWLPEGKPTAKFGGAAVPRARTDERRCVAMFTNGSCWIRLGNSKLYF
jgi:hypothetical protein